jgi:CheY-like chemotaxis protein
MQTQSFGILLAEDDRIDAKAFLRAAQGAGISNPVTVASDGAEAWALLTDQRPTAEPPGLVVLDINMPRMTGLELLRRMRADDRLRHLPVLMLTTSDHQRDRIEAQDLGVTAYILKSELPGGFRRVVELLTASPDGVPTC